MGVFIRWLRRKKSQKKAGEKILGEFPRCDVPDHITEKFNLWRYDGWPRFTVRTFPRSRYLKRNVVWCVNIKESKS